MDINVVDHYAVLDLPSGEQGAKLSQIEISKAYRKKALDLHPDKRPNDPRAHVNFQKLKTSYDFLMDEKERKFFDSTRKTMSNQDARECAAAAASRDAAAARYVREEVNHGEYLNKYGGRKVIIEGASGTRVMGYVKKVSRSMSRGKINKEAARILAMYEKKKL